MIDVAIFLENELIFDLKLAKSTSVVLQQNEAYKIRVETVLILSDDHRPASIHMMWETPNIKASVIPKFYLYDSATDIDQSPFPVTVV